MLAIALAVLPIFLVILGGRFIAKRRMVEPAFWSGAEKLVYYILFPALLLNAVADAPLDEIAFGPMAGTIFGTMGIASLLLLLGRRAITADGPSFTSVFQCTIRMNTYLGFAIALAIAGNWGVQGVAVTVAFYVPCANLLSVAILVRYGAAGSSALRDTAKAIARNPLILAIAGGLLLNVSGIGAPPGIAPVLSILGQAALGLGLLALGAGLDLKGLWRDARPVGLTCFFKLACMPALGLSLALLFGLEGQAAFGTLLLMATPAAPASYILASQLGGNAPLVAVTVTAQVALSLLSLPLVITLADGFFPLPV